MRSHYQPMVITPAHPDADDSKYPYRVARYPSIYTLRFAEYPAGIPFSPKTAKALETEKVALLHAHCPIMSTYMARQLQQITNAPIVLTYHTKFTVDIETVIKHKALQTACAKMLVSNIAACNEIWTVSRGAGENLRSLGYEGEYILMPNGVDIPCKKASQLQINSVTTGYDLPPDTPVYLFVGRMMWYKGLQIIIDALARLRTRGKPFRMVFIGDGQHRTEIEQYASACGISHQCIFTGPIRNREELRVWYSRADLFLFPSTFDTNGLVVREAAACSLPSVLIKGSCAAEGVTDCINGFLIEENAESLATCLCSLTKEKMRVVGRSASKDLYLSWENAVKVALDRYQVVIDNYKSSHSTSRHKSRQNI